MEVDSFVELALRLGRSGRTKGQEYQCLAGALPVHSWCLVIA